MPKPVNTSSGEKAFQVLKSDPLKSEVIHVKELSADS